MTAGSILNNQGRVLLLHRTYSTSVSYSRPSVFKIGRESSTPLVTDTDLVFCIPISNGTAIFEGQSSMTGSTDTQNSSATTAIYKEGAGKSDNTGQNLLSRGVTSSEKLWEKTVSTAINLSEYWGLWFYFSTTGTALQALSSTGTAIEVRLGSSSTAYHVQTAAASTLSTGWNWISGNTKVVSGLTQVGTVFSPYDYFGIKLWTQTSTATFATSDAVFDLLRQWKDSDLVKSFATGYPVISETTFDVEMRGELLVSEANGFLIDSSGVFNTDSTKKMNNESVFTEDSKSSTDQFTFIWKNRLL